MVWKYIVIYVITSLISLIFAPKPQNEKPASLEDVEVPSIEEGKEIPVIFGTMEVSPFVAWYGDFSSKAIREGGKGK